MTRTMKPYPAYKESGIAWLGEIPAHWEIKPLKFFSDIVLGKMLTPEDKGDFFQRPYLRAKNILWENVDVSDVKEMWFSKKELALYRLQYNDLLVSEGGEVGRTAVWRNEIDECYIQNSINKVRVSRENVPKYFLYQFVLFGKYGHFDAIVDRVSIGHLTKEKLKDVAMFVPPTNEQIAIADYLDRNAAAIDTLIAKKERQIELLQEQRTAVINHAVTKGLNPDALMKDSGIPWLGQIPTHWEIKRLKHISPRILVGVVVNPSSYVDEKGTVPFFVGGDVSENHISTDNVRRITHESNQTLAKSMLRTGDLVVVRVGDPGVAAVVPKHLDGSNCASMMVVGRHSSFVSEYLCFVMNSKVGKSQVEIVQYGAAQKQFNISHAVDFFYPIPPLTEQQEIANYVVQKFSKFGKACNQIQQEIKLIREYRTALISAAVTGKIDVRP